MNSPDYQLGVNLVKALRPILQSVASKKGEVVFFLYVVILDNKTKKITLSRHMMEISEYPSGITSEKLKGTSEESQRIIESFRTQGIKVIVPESPYGKIFVLIRGEFKDDEALRQHIKKIIKKTIGSYRGN